MSEQEKELQEGEFDLLALEPGRPIVIAKEADSTILAEKTPVTGGLVIYLEMGGRREVIDFRNSEEVAKIEEQIRAKRGPKPRTHKHERPYCRKFGEPDACGQHECFGGGAIHVSCINLPLTKKNLCICIGES